jgi:hypothetical protein
MQWISIGSEGMIQRTQVKKNYEETQIGEHFHKSPQLMTTYFNMISGFCRYNPAGPEKTQQEQKNGEEVAQPKTCCEEIESLKEQKSCGGGVKKDITNLNMLKPIVWSTSHLGAASLCCRCDRWDPFGPVGLMGPSGPAETRGRDQQ